jgi:hypothetical protein
MDVTAAVLAATVTVGALAPVPRPDAVPSIPAAAAASAGQDILPTTRRQATFSAASPKRPAPLVPLYASLAALQGLDIYTTSKAVSGGAAEANPAMKPVAGKPWAATAVKAAATATSIFFIERAWKQNRKGAVILATAINVATAAVVAHNVNVSSRK